MRVHSTLGNGFQEVIYQRALEIEMANEGLGFVREMEMPIFYKEIQIGMRRVDFFVEGEIMVELKAIIEIGRYSSGVRHKLSRSLQYENRPAYQFRKQKFTIQKTIK